MKICAPYRKDLSAIFGSAHSFGGWCAWGFELIRVWYFLLLFRKHSWTFERRIVWLFYFPCYIAFGNTSFELGLSALPFDVFLALPNLDLSAFYRLWSGPYRSMLGPCAAFAAWQICCRFDSRFGPHLWQKFQAIQVGFRATIGTIKPK